MGRRVTVRHRRLREERNPLRPSGMAQVVVRAPAALAASPSERATPWTRTSAIRAARTTTTCTGRGKKTIKIWCSRAANPSRCSPLWIFAAWTEQSIEWHLPLAWLRAGKNLIRLDSFSPACCGDWLAAPSSPCIDLPHPRRRAMPQSSAARLRVDHGRLRRASIRRAAEGNPRTA